MPKWLKIKSLPMLIISCLASVIIWLVVMSSINPTMNIRFNDVDVTILGTTELYNRNGFSILSESDFSFDIEFSGGRNSILRLKRDDISVTCDVSEINKNGTNRVPCTVTTPYDDIVVVDLKNIFITIEVDKIQEEPIKLRYELTGELPENYMLGEVSLLTDSVLVNGPQAELSNIAYGLITADISELRNSETLNLPVTLISTSGEPVELKYAQQITRTADLNVPILMQKEVPFTYSIDASGGLTRDHVDVTVSPKSVTLVGDPEILSEHEFISLGIIELDNIGDGKTYEQAFFVPAGTSCSTNRSTVTVDIGVKDVETRTFKVEGILATGSVEGFDASVATGYLNIRLRGNKSILDTVSTEDFIITVALDQLPQMAGFHNLTPEVSFVPALNLELVPSDHKVTVKLVPIEPEPEPIVVDADIEPNTLDPNGQGSNSKE